MATRPQLVLLDRARRALHWGHRELAAGLGVSERTATRIQSGDTPFDLVRLARHVHPVDRGLAEEILALAGQTLVSAGFEAALAPPPQPPAPSAPLVLLPPPPSVEVLRMLVEGIVCAVADAAGSPPGEVREGVLIVLRKALEIDLDLRAVAQAGLLGDGREPAPGEGPRAPRT